MMDSSAARDSILLLGLVDWVPLERVHFEVARAGDVSAATSEVQSSTLQLIESLVSEELFVLGTLAENGTRFMPWDGPLSELMQTLFTVYVEGHDDPDTWRWFCWLNLTKRGEKRALPMEKKPHRGTHRTSCVHLWDCQTRSSSWIHEKHWSRTGLNLRVCVSVNHGYWARS
jgi:hypothetical protein